MTGAAHAAAPCTAVQHSCSTAWTPLHTSAQELSLEFTLVTGQSFRWDYHEGEGCYVGMVGPRLVALRQGATTTTGAATTAGTAADTDVYFRVLGRGEGVDAEGDEAALREYLNLQQPGGVAGGSGAGGGVCLHKLSAAWASRCTRFAAIRPYITGARVLRQDPVECLFQFICSSNNHISRIKGMVDRLAAAYGTPIHFTPTGPAPPPAGKQQLQHGRPQAGGGPSSPPSPATPAPVHVLAHGPPHGAHTAAAAGAAATPAKRAPPLHAAATATPSPAAGPAGGGARAGADGVAGGLAGVAGRAYFAFPTLQQLAAAQEEDLRAAGFGYRARFITGTVAALAGKEGGGEAWLMGLRLNKSYEEARDALASLPGVGPKVAACVCLFALDKHAAIPVDTHVWQLACKHYLPGLRGKALTAKLHGMVQAAFVERFGEYAGWAHNTLFIAELASQQHRFPVHLRAGKAGKATGRSGARGAGASSDEDEGGSSSTATASEGGAAGEAGAAGAAGAGGRGKGKRGAGPAAGSGTGTDLQPGKRVRKARVWS